MALMLYVKNSSSKYFLGYNDDAVIRPLCTQLPQMIRYVRYFVSNNIMSFKVTEKKTGQKYEKILQKRGKSQQFNE